MIGAKEQRIKGLINQNCASASPATNVKTFGGIFDLRAIFLDERSNRIIDLTK